MAEDADLDLVEVAPSADPPVCKIMDYGKFKYQESIRAKEARKKQGHQTVKEIRFGPKIGIHDYDTKKARVTEFLEDGHRVKVSVRFKGREMHHTELGCEPSETAGGRSRRDRNDGSGLEARRTDHVDDVRAREGKESRIDAEGKVEQSSAQAVPRHGDRKDRPSESVGLALVQVEDAIAPDPAKGKQGRIG